MDQLQFTEEYQRIYEDIKPEPLVISMRYNSIYDGPSDKYKDGDLIECVYDITKDGNLKLKEIKKIDEQDSIS